MGTVNLFVSCTLALSAAPTSANGGCNRELLPLRSFSISAPAAHDSSLLLMPWQDFIAEGAQRFGLPDAWIRRVMRSESSGRTRLDGRPITSPKGAMGLMQIMPRTYEALRARYGLGRDPHDPHDNVLAGSAYLRELYDRYGYPNLFAAYNAGPARFDRFLFDGKPLPDETISYVEGILPGVAMIQSTDVPISPTEPSISSPVAQTNSRSMSAGGLFVVNMVTAREQYLSMDRRLFVARKPE